MKLFNQKPLPIFFLNSLLRVIVLASFLFQVSCATTGTFSKTGYAFINLTKESGGLGYDRGSKDFGEACSTNILGFVSFGDSSIQAAKRENNIHKVTHYDTSYTGVAGIFGQVCTKAYGSRKTSD